MATTSLSIVQRLGGPTMTTLCATFLGWRLRSVPVPGAFSGALSGAFTSAFFLLCTFHALLFAAALRLPLSVDQTTEEQPEHESPVLMEMLSE
jgi:hypothetical protein